MAHMGPESLQRLPTSSLRASLLKEPRPICFAETIRKRGRETKSKMCVFALRV